MSWLFCWELLKWCTAAFKNNCSVDCKGEGRNHSKQLHVVTALEWNKRTVSECPTECNLILKILTIPWHRIGHRWTAKTTRRNKKVLHSKSGSPKTPPESAQNNNDFFTSDIFCWKKESPVFSKYLARPVIVAVDNAVKNDLQWNVKHLF